MIELLLGCEEFKALLQNLTTTVAVHFQDDTPTPPAEKGHKPDTR